MWAMTLWEHGVPYLQWGIVAGAASIAVCTDLAWRRIPNWITFPLLLSGFVFAGVSAGWFGLLDSFSACVILSVPYIILYVFAQGGAGDAKMMGAIGAWLGMINGLAALAGVALTGIVLALIYAAMKNRAREVTTNVSEMTQGLLLATFMRKRVVGAISPEVASQPMLTMPYGVAIFAGTCVSAIGVLLWRG